jgi:DNA-binding GntR family transcriptional regulator
LTEIISNTLSLNDGAVVPQLHSILRDRIVTGELPPGLRVSETEFATAYDVSRQPVREAFIKLAEEDLVIVRPQRGTFVKRISVPAVLTARFIRESVEADLVRIVAHQATPQMLASLENALEKQRVTAKTGTPADFMKLDQAFHRLLSEFAGKPDVANYLSVLNIPVNRVRNISARQFSPDRLVAQHTLIVDAIRNADPASTEQAMRMHLREINNDLPQIVQANPDFFEGIDAIT